jgi:hypothetical protein
LIENTHPISQYPIPRPKRDGNGQQLFKTHHQYTIKCECQKFFTYTVSAFIFRLTLDHSRECCVHGEGCVRSLKRCAFTRANTVHICVLSNFRVFLFVATWIDEQSYISSRTASVCLSVILYLSYPIRSTLSARR